MVGWMWVLGRGLVFGESKSVSKLFLPVLFVCVLVQLLFVFAFPFLVAVAVSSQLLFVF